MRDKITVATGHYTDANGTRIRFRAPVDSEAEADALQAQYRDEAPDRYVWLRTDAVYEPRDIPKVSDTHFFDADTMRFFGSRIGSEWHIVGHRLYFVTTERRGWDDYTRGATVRVWNADEDSIDTIGELNQYASPRTAYRAAQRAAVKAYEKLTEVTA
jgi:hypothetical protein